MVRPITVPQFGIREAYAGNESELSSALGIYLASWFIVTFVSHGHAQEGANITETARLLLDLFRSHLEGLDRTQRFVLLPRHHFPPAVSLTSLASCGASMLITILLAPTECAPTSLESLPSTPLEAHSASSPRLSLSTSPSPVFSPRIPRTSLYRSATCPELLLPRTPTRLSYNSRQRTFPRRLVKTSRLLLISN